MGLKFEMLTGVVVLGLIDILVVNLSVVMMEDLNLKFEVKLILKMTSVSVIIPNINSV